MKVIFLDRDGTINEDKGYVCSIDNVKYLPYAVEGMNAFLSQGYEIIIVTNQSGIARGYFTEEDYQIFQRQIEKDLSTYAVNILCTYYCPHHPQGIIKKYAIDCNCRKPKTGLFWKAIHEYSIDIEHSFAIGDRMRDLAIVDECGVRGILLAGNEEEERSAYKKNIPICRNLIEAAKITGR